MLESKQGMSLLSKNVNSVKNTSIENRHHIYIVYLSIASKRQSFIKHSIAAVTSPRITSL